jgi:hypothetical protein
MFRSVNPSAAVCMLIGMPTVPPDDQVPAEMTSCRSQEYFSFRRVGIPATDTRLIHL